ncbi:MAG TPA: MFS transporter, partial [Pricia sp.]|nr:MFS transporter [Pricia sp.]
MSLGYQMQSLFVGAGILLANASLFLFQDWFGGGEESAGSIPKWLYYSFFIGSFLSVATILWSVLTTPEIPPTDEESAEIKAHRSKNFSERFMAPFAEIADAVKKMPQFMWKLAGVYLFQWYALFVYWQFIIPLFILTMGFDTSEAAAQAAKMSTTYNIATAVVALMLVPMTLKFGGKKIYAASLFGTGLALLAIPYIYDPIWVLAPMVLFGIGWAAMMGIPYTMVSRIVPQERRGVYMGILNMMIVIPMGIETLTFGAIYDYFLDNSAVNAMLFGGTFFILAAFLALRLNVSRAKAEVEDSDMI